MNPREDQFKGMEFSDMEEGGELATINQIVLMHIKKISNMICQELTPGYWDEKPIKVGSGTLMVKTYHPDLRIGYINAIDFLTDLVYPNSNQEFKDFIDDIYKNEEDLEETEEVIKRKVKIRKKVFRNMNIMFENRNFFDSSTGATEVYKGH